MDLLPRPLLLSLGRALLPGLLAIGALRAAAPADEGPRATTTAGPIRGFVDQGVNVFKGIP